MKELLKEGERILLFVIDGVGGLPKNGKTELEAANTPNLDKLAEKSVLGFLEPLPPGITPGSGPAHLSIFGYDPLKYNIGRGILEALGIGVKIEKNDLAIRGNFCQIDKNDIIIDRRAGRIETDECKRLVKKISDKIKEIEGVKISFYPGKEHRFVIVLSGENVSDKIKETDPQKEGLKPYEPEPLSKEAEFTSRVLNKMLNEIKNILKDEKANFILMRGYSKPPEMESFYEKFGLRALGIAYYPMYKGLAKLVGMDVIENVKSFEEGIEILKDKHKDYDFVYLHFKETDKAGEDGDFEKKVKEIERVDKYIPEILKCDFKVIAITGDHSTPWKLKSHSWHPVPLLLYSEYAGIDETKRFTEKEAIKGYLGKIKGHELIWILLANAKRLLKYGA
jgi:2,3-bisphosphoglycerate-independent phosphoglycerate mutase